MADNRQTETAEREKLPLSKAVEYVLDECRMVLPGIQALLGFQLIVVLSPGFDQKLRNVDQRWHLLAIALIAIAVAIIMTPAAFNRQTEPREASEEFIVIATRLLISSMPPLAISICVDFYLIAKVILGGAASGLLATGLFAVFLVLWFILPRARFLQRLLLRQK